MVLILGFIILTVVGCSQAVQPPAPSVMDATAATVLVHTPALEMMPTLEERPTPSALPPGINPLTGLPAADPVLLERRPIIVKVQNVPRESRPQWGLSLADIVYEYYIEYGDTRFAAVYYGQDSSLVGPIRSARHVDMHLVEMYQSLLIFGGAYADLYEQMLESDFGDRLIREGPNTAAALRRFDPNGWNYLLADTSAVKEVVELYQMDNERPDLQGMVFALEPPQDGQTGADLFVRFSGGMYSHWQYDPAGGGYVRYADAENDVDRNKPVYALQTDRLTEAPILAENVVILLAPYRVLIEETASSPGVYDIDLLGKGKAFLARDGMIYPAFWQREMVTEVLHLVDGEGNAVPFKPGRTWFEVLEASSTIAVNEGQWQFTFNRP